MRSKIFLFTGFVLFAVGVFIYYMIGLESTQITVQNRPVAGDNGLREILAWSVGGGIAALGGFFLLVGVVGLARSSKQNKEMLEIMQTGVKTEGKIVFVDKNYSLLVNNAPIYSIVEYNYKDRLGNQHTRRIETVSSDLVIRNQIQVGAVVPIKYKANDPSKSIILLQDLASQQASPKRGQF